LLAPDLIFAEVGNIIWKKHRMKELVRSVAEEIVDAIVSTPIEIETSQALLPLAVEMGLAYGITVHHAIYVTLAMIRENVMMTADRKLVEMIGKTDLKKTVACLGDSIR
jgi:predicted nucleic acid-binding protein